MGAAALAAVAIGVTCRARRAASSSRALPLRPRPVSSTSACRESPRVSTPRARRRSPQLMAMRLLYEGLVTFGDRGDIEPALATSWGVSRDGLVWTFRLRQDVQLHDGTPLGPDEILAALGERISADESPEGAPGWLRPFRGAGRIVREVRRGDGASIQVVLGQPYAPVLALLAHPALAVAVPRADGHRVGSGPYRAVELAPDRLVLEAAPSWRGEPPQSARLTLHAILDDAAALAGLGPGGSLHAALVRVPPAWAALGLQVVSAPTWRLGLMALRTDRGLTSRKTVRQAVALALNPGLHPAGPRSVGGAARGLASTRRVGGPRQLGPFPSTRSERVACWRRWRRRIRR